MKEIKPHSSKSFNCCHYLKIFRLLKELLVEITILIKLVQCIFREATTDQDYLSCLSNTYFSKIICTLSIEHYVRNFFSKEDYFLKII